MTLVEVLVAVVICGAALTLAAGGVASAVRADAYAARLTTAADHAELLLGRLECGALPLEDARGDFEEDGQPDLAWEVTVDTTDIEGLSAAQVTVRWEAQGQQRELSVERLFFLDPLQGGVR
jgi:Tfp pilus assembly protein PilV